MKPFEFNQELQLWFSESENLQRHNGLLLQVIGMKFVSIHPVRRNANKATFVVTLLAAFDVTLLLLRKPDLLTQQSPSQLLTCCVFYLGI